ncbi:MAG: dicarboxylate/amino acid:cation symporter [Firmicutes bacterium]|nr:dicarboxylate/amino acid:cation symporter [Bacillota bacterium]
MKNILKRLSRNLIFWLVIAVSVGFTIGSFANTGVMNVFVALRHITGQLVSFIVPLVILGMIAPSIVRMGKNASRMLVFSLVLSYTLIVVVAFLATGIGYLLLPMIGITEDTGALNTLPANLLQLNFPVIMPAISALVLSILVGLAVVWTKSERTAKLMEEFHEMTKVIIRRVMIPVIPIFIGAIFATMAFEGRFVQHLPSYFQLILIAIATQFIWLGLIYGGAALYTRKNPFHVLRHYGRPYLTAFGTMSSAATLGVVIENVGREKSLNPHAVKFGIPFFANVFLVSSALTMTLFVMGISLFVYGALPSFGTMILFNFLLGVFIVAAPGVPGGSVVASLALVTAVLGFTEVGAGLLIAMWALQDSFGTATNITSDGAMLMILSKYSEKRGLVFEEAEESTSLDNTQDETAVVVKEDVDA